MLAAEGADARIIAGGQTLVPMLSMRLARPRVLIDIMRLPELAAIAEANGSIHVGAAVRQTDLLAWPDLAIRQPMLAAALPWVGHAGIGQQVRWGLELATREVNAAGGIAGRSVELIFEDEEANPSVAVQKAEKLFQVAKVDFLTATVNSGSTLAVGQLAERSGKLIATTVSFADSITGDKCSPNVFRVNAKAGQQSAALAAWLAKEKPNGQV